MDDLEKKYHYLRVEEHQKLDWKIQYDLHAAELKRGLVVLQQKIADLEVKSTQASCELADVRDMLKMKGMQPILISERDATACKEKAEDAARFDFVCLSSQGAFARSTERDKQARKCAERRADRGYDEFDFD